MSKIWPVVSFGARAAVFGGAVYLTVQQGLWTSSNHDGARAFKSFRENVIPVTNDFVKQLPNGQSISQSIKAKWNSGVEWTADGVASFPSTVSDFSKSTISSIKQTVKSEK